MRRGGCSCRQSARCSLTGMGQYFDPCVRMISSGLFVSLTWGRREPSPGISLTKAPSMRPFWIRCSSRAVTSPPLWPFRKTSRLVAFAANAANTCPLTGSTLSGRIPASRCPPGHTLAHIPQLVHAALSMQASTRPPGISFIEMAPTGHTATHVPQLKQSPFSTTVSIVVSVFTVRPP